MKGNENLIKTLNELLADELTAISQLMVHSEMCHNWGYEALHKRIEKQAIDEMHHAEWLIQRILFLEGMPLVSKLNEMKIGKSVLEMLTNDQDAETGAIRSYNAGIALASEVGDESTGDLLTTILKMEEGHHDWAKKQRTQIEQMGLETYLSNQTGAE
ncbi:MAG TPA: bacterioferritin [Anaerolineales bacterium]|nr:bacterioferritin [Anaerolineales bacterium]HMS00777.1 bacterioferritin [Anaerolineales bacterium]HNQ95598.1 bacterioferritin [Anaerolineales bacterium]HNS59358.1 bacterioferritin [Anaerolineales bacterium]